ncbi:MAG TPA: NUDIX domain-containing protein [Kineosporiaceae bacterium]|nr:NUDIX domain-containing protein [Kineosporiaceae bacterium]
MSERELLRRRAARVLVLDVADRLLLLRGIDPAVPDRSFWFTVGGGLERGETLRAGAVRELHEETGLVVTEEALVGPVYSDESSFAFDRWWIEQRNDFFAVRVEETTVRPAALEDIEVASIQASAWWTADQLRAQADGRPNDGPGRPGEIVYPQELAAVLEAAVLALRPRSRDLP